MPTGFNALPFPGAAAGWLATAVPGKRAEALIWGQAISRYQHQGPATPTSPCRIARRPLPLPVTREAAAPGLAVEAATDMVTAPLVSYQGALRRPGWP